MAELTKIFINLFGLLADTVKYSLEEAKYYAGYYLGIVKKSAVVCGLTGLLLLALMVIGMSLKMNWLITTAGILLTVDIVCFLAISSLVYIALNKISEKFPSVKDFITNLKSLFKFGILLSLFIGITGISSNPEAFFVILILSGLIIASPILPGHKNATRLLDIRAYTLFAVMVIFFFATKIPHNFYSPAEKIYNKMAGNLPTEIPYSCENFPSLELFDPITQKAVVWYSISETGLLPRLWMNGENKFDPQSRFALLPMTPTKRTEILGICKKQKERLNASQPQKVAKDEPPPAPKLEPKIKEVPKVEFEPKPQPTSVTIPQGTIVNLITTEPIPITNRDVAINASLKEPLMLDNLVVFPKGSSAMIRIRPDKHSTIVLELVSLRSPVLSANMTTLPLLVKVSGKESGAGNLAKTLGAIGAGAVIGDIAGDGKGAAVGAILGGTGMAVVNAVQSKNNQLELPTGYLLVFTTNTPVVAYPR